MSIIRMKPPASLPARKRAPIMFSSSSEAWLTLQPVEKAVKAGLRFGDRGTQTSRTIMLSELTELIAALPEAATREEYAGAIISDNLLGKQTTATRRHTNQRLGELYGLDRRIPIFKVIRRLWEIDVEGRPLLALLCALGRDPLLRATAPCILSLEDGEELRRTDFVKSIEHSIGDRFNESILDKVARNSGSSWTQSGHLDGRVRKIRKHVEPTPSSVAFALWLGSLYSLAGEELLSTPWMSIFDCSRQELLDLVLRAKTLRLIDARIGGGVIEINPAVIDPTAEVT